uniref:IRG-type G domain-containing protein n=1 Tax=Gopherus evgoodei TaxID=1825980 RepID=A0A8C4YP59_9SAUR
MEALKAAVWKGNLTEAAAKAKEALVRADKIPLNIAVTGVAGSGKSSFVNAIRGLGDTDYSSAAIGITETTMESTAYPHPRYPDVIFCDLPGIGTPAFKSDTYLEQVTFSHYDFFIIISSPRLTCHDISLAQEIQRLGKKFYFVHSKVDLDLTNEKQNGDKEGTLKWRNCIKDLKEAGVASTQVFLISKWDLGKYDFPKLQKVLVDELPSHKRHACLQSLSNIVKETLKKKKEQLQTQIWLKSLASCGVAAIPIPGLSIVCDVAMLMTSLKEYCRNFGLDENSLAALARQANKPIAELKAVIKSPLPEQRKRNFNKERTLQEIREDCKENLRKAGETSLWVFLLCSWELTEYDFQLLQETLENELDDQKRHIFILVMPNISAKILEKKKAELQEHIWEVALLSCAIGVLPVPGLSLICDVAILVFHMKRYCLAFGLDEESLTRLAKQIDKPVAELKSAIRNSPLASAITKEFILSLLSRSLCGALMVVELILNFVPGLGSLAGGGISFATTYYMLQSFLDDTAEDAQNILTKALEPRAEESIKQHQDRLYMPIENQTHLSQPCQNL